MLPADVQVTAGAGGCTVAFEDSKRSLFGVQFELERNDPDGSTILKNFARDICGCTPWFTMDAALAEARRALTEASIEGGFAVLRRERRRGFHGGPRCWRIRRSASG